jgi:molybdate transport system regulatory protein
MPAVSLVEGEPAMRVGIAGAYAEGLDSPLSQQPGQPNMRKSSATSLPTLSVRIDLDPEGRIGPGKIQLLEQIRSQGSISAAGRAMNMSYKRAWDLVDEINRVCRRAAVERQAGGKNGGGAILTPFGLSLVARYRKIERSAEHAARKELLALRADMGARRRA